MEAAQEAKKRILVVEDEGLIADDIQRRLERLGYAVPAIASSGEEALRMARSTPLDLVLMDIRLQGETDGIATAQALRNELRMPVVYLTAHADADTLSRATGTEPLGYILKPVGDLSLRSAVQVALYRNEMERRVRSSEAWLAATLRSIGEGIVATGETGEIVFLNPVAEQLTGWTGAQAIGRPLMDVLRLKVESSGQEAANPIFDLAPGECRPYWLTNTLGSGTPVEVSCAQNRSDEARLGSILVVREIRARREMEGRLIQSQRMEAVANMAGGLAHDFNNLLMVILGYADELAADLPRGRDRDRVIEIKQAATLAGSISNQLLTLSRRGGSSAETLDINAVIGEMGPLIARSLGTGRRLALELGTPAGMVRGDRNRLKQVFLNLALNARDAMPQGGEMRIESAPVDIDAGNPRWRECRPGRYVRIRVTDSGQGMDGATLARIFEPFFTTKKSGAGTGLGLAVVHAIIEQSGGYISASSEIGKGTCFEILLASAEEPRADVDTPAAAKAGETAAAVLLVDEDGAVRRLMRAREKPESYQRLELCNAASAMRFSRIRPGPVGMAPSGVAMPGMGGLELADRQEGNAGFVFGCGSVEPARGGPLPMPVSSQPCPAAELAWRARTSVEQAPAVAR